MDTRPDYPAAHSMDSTWFAVDDDGHVGVFESGEGGAVPVGAADEDGRGDALNAFMRAGLARLAARGEIPWGRHLQADDRPWVDAIFLVGDVAAAKRALGDSFAQPCGDPIPVDGGLATPLRSVISYSERVKRLHEEGLCACCFGADAKGLARFGAFAFVCDAGSAWPYTREGVPASRLAVWELAPEVARTIHAVRIPGVRFAERSQVQPLEHTDANTWGDESFGGTDGETYPVGRNSTIAIGDRPPVPIEQVERPRPREGRNAPGGEEASSPRSRPRRWWQFWR